MTGPEDDGGAAHEPEMDRLHDSLFEELAAASHDSEIARLRARVAELEAATTWRPIATAPQWADADTALIGKVNSEGRWVWLAIWDAAWDRDSTRYYGATHWMPLPPPPEAAP